MAVEKRKGAAMTNAPIAAHTKRAQRMRQESARVANRIKAAPSPISLRASHTSSTPIMGGCVTSQIPSAILVKWAQRSLRCSLAHLRLVTGAQLLRMLARIRRFGDLGRRREPVSLVPACRDPSSGRRSLPAVRVSGDAAVPNPAIPGRAKYRVRSGRLPFSP